VTRDILVQTTLPVLVPHWVHSTPYSKLSLAEQPLENTQMATIKVLQNGPYLVQGDDITAVDWNGETYAISKRPFALCRCGGSTTKPFCDGTHSRTGFKAAEAAVPGSQDKPAIKP
jgi:CDGSH-type Zn-finger protein